MPTHPQSRSARLQTYLSGVIDRYDEPDTAFARWFRQATKWLFDLLRNAMIVGLLKYLAAKTNSGLLENIAALAFGVLLSYCLSYTNTWRITLLYPWYPANWARVMDVLVALVFLAPLTFLIVYTVPHAIEEIAKAQAR